MYLAGHVIFHPALPDLPRLHDSQSYDSYKGVNGTTTHCVPGPASRRHLPEISRRSILDTCSHLPTASYHSILAGLSIPVNQAPIPHVGSACGSNGSGCGPKAASSRSCKSMTKSIAVSELVRMPALPPTMMISARSASESNEIGALSPLSSPVRTNKIDIAATRDMTPQV